jgi:hypothetical protein
MDHLSYITDPNFWITQLLFFLLAYSSRFYSEWRQGRAARMLRLALEELVELEDGRELARRWEAEFHETPRLLRPYVARRIAREVRKKMRAEAQRAQSANTAASRVEEEQPESSANTGGARLAVQPASVTDTAAELSGQQQPTMMAMDVAHTSADAGPADSRGITGVKDMALAAEQATAGSAPSTDATRPAEKPIKPRKRLIAILVARLTTVAASVVGGDLGREYAEEFALDLALVKNPAVKFFYALSNVCGAVKLRFIYRTMPWFHKHTPNWVRQLARKGGRVVDAVVASAALSGSITGLLDSAVLLASKITFGTETMIILALPVAAGSYYLLNWVRRRWQLSRPPASKSET